MEHKDILKYARSERKRQKSSLSLIASEGIIYPEALKISSYPLCCKYSEGYPGKRFYAGCRYIDEIENLAISAAKKAFNCSFANVQCYSGSIANLAIYKALLNPGDRILSMEMKSGGHLTHSSRLSSVSYLYEVHTYCVDENTLRIDYDDVRRIALEKKPKLIIAGASSYPFRIDFKAFREIADEIGAYLLADICHLSAFIVSGLHDHCFPYAHVAMTTTHKQLRGYRGAIILWNDESLSVPINKSVFPGLQGGMNPGAVAMNAIALKKASSTEFLDYSKRLLDNAQALLQRFLELGVCVVGGGTESHMLLIDVRKSFNITGDIAINLLERAGFIANQNLIPFDPLSPLSPSGIRIGTLSLSVLKATKEDCFWIADQIYAILVSKKTEDINLVRKKLKAWLRIKYGQ